MILTRYPQRESRWDNTQKEILCSGLLLTRQLQARLPNNAARDTLTRLREAFEVAEAAIPGMTSAFVLEIVENVEQVDESEM